MRQPFRSARPYRSMLYVPGHKLDWIRKAPRYGADAYIYDLEDAVPIGEKPAARAATETGLAELAGEPFGRFVRINGWHTGQTLADLTAVVRPGLDGVLLPKVEDVDDVVALDRLLEELECQRGIELGRVEIFPLCETALSMYRHFDICRASERVVRTTSAVLAVPGDQTRAMGVHLSGGLGEETVLVNGRAGLEARAAGVHQMTGGMTTTIGDLGLVRELAERSKALGATGSMSIHPSHVPVHNEVFSPSAAEIDRARAVMVAMASAVERGDAAVQLDGEMVDYAHVRESLDLLRSAQAFGLAVGEYPDVPVLSY
ncbi:MAG TPA: CoA ester lyase [Acidimicrobiales bacterium]|nr:CoA ester lyase [Acidimicrobiales bacterium]